MLHLRQRAFYADGRLYQLMVAGTREAVTGASGDRFLDSFLLLK